MSEEDKDIDIESDDSSDNNASRLGRGNPNISQAEKRAHHNALERKRRDHIKDSFNNLRNAVPSLNGEKASRAQILKNTAEFIQSMRHKIKNHQQDCEDLEKQNDLLESQIQELERKKTGGYSLEDTDNIIFKSEMGSDSDDADDDYGRRTKKIRAC
ncbi:MAX family protein [Megaselia abdita]